MKKIFFLTKMYLQAIGNKYLSLMIQRLLSNKINYAENSSNEIKENVGIH